MTLEQAHRVVKFYGDDLEIRNLWDIIAHMKKNVSMLDSQERAAIELLEKDLYVGLANAEFQKSKKTIISDDDGYTD